MSVVDKFKQFMNLEDDDDDQYDTDQCENTH